MNKNLARQQDARAAPEEKLRVSLAEIEKIKFEQTLYKKTAEADKASLLKHAEVTEGCLNWATKELTGLKRHISRMTSVVFGKHFVCKIVNCHHCKET